MRVLFVSNIFPASARVAVYGIFNRMGLLIDAAKALSQSLDLLVFAPAPDAGGPSESERQAIATELWGGPHTQVFVASRAQANPKPSFAEAYLSGFADFTRLPSQFHGYYMTTGPEQMAALKRCLDRQPDWILAHRLAAMGPLLRCRRSLPPIVFDLDDIEHRAFLSGLRIQPFWPGKALLYLQTPALALGERRAIRQARLTFVCSADDCDAMRGLGGRGTVVALPNSVRLPPAALEIGAEPVVALVSSLTYPPNAAAADFMIETIWPMVRAKMPSAELLIVGAKPGALRSYGRRNPGVTFTGFVDDLEAIYRRARLIVCPIHAGGGTRIKVIEAASYGRPVVSTTFGASGLDFRDGEDILLRDDPGAFAQACLKLLDDTALCRKLGTAARCLAERQYSRGSVLELAQDCIRRSLPEFYRADADAALPMRRVLV